LASIVRTTPNKHYRQGVISPDELRDGFPGTAESLFAYDAIILGSYEASNLTAEQHRLLTQFVDRRGGSVLMLAGRFGLSAGGWQNTALAQTLPVRLPKGTSNAFVRRDARVALTSYGMEAPITRLDADPQRNSDRWRNLPPLADYQNLGELKPGAIVLLDAAPPPGATPLLARHHRSSSASLESGTSSRQRWKIHLPPNDQSQEPFRRQPLHAHASHPPPRLSLASAHPPYDD